MYTRSMGDTTMYVWRVWKNNRFAGYVDSPSETYAYLKAKEKFGQNIMVERIVLPKDQRSTFSG
jgi:hypothetical protein